MFSSNASAVSGGVNYIEDVFSTYLYTGTGATQTITNGLDLSTKGGATWIKSRSAATNNCFFDTVRGATKYLSTNGASQQNTDANGLTAFGTTGFTLGSGNTAGDEVNTSSATFGSWSFAKQTKFFDIVTWTGNGTVRTIPHSLGSVPGCIMVKSYSSGSYGSTDWVTYHRSLGATKKILLNTTDAAATSSVAWNNTEPTSTVFTLGTDSDVNGASDTTYIAYIFAHDAGGFGLTGTDNVISCGSFTTGTGFGAFNVSLGWEPQWVLIKRSDSTSDWRLLDTMRGFDTRDLTGDAEASSLYPNLSSAEVSEGYIGPYATGFSSVYTATPSATYIYIAIRRGPMKVPTDGTTVFAAQAPANTNVYTSNFPVDMLIRGRTDGSADNAQVWSRLIGKSPFILTSAASAENFSAIDFDYNTKIIGGSSDSNNQYRMPWMFRRAPSFFDVVCYSGTGIAQTLTHNLAAVPQLMISRRRDSAAGWAVYSATLGATKYMRLQTDDAFSTGSTLWNDTAPTSTQFTLGSTQSAISATYVQYLFATCDGVSKVGSYTGTATTQQINCGFTAGSRFVLIKRTDDTGSWYVWDSARGIVAGNDPYLLLNSANAQVTSTDYVDTYAAGFELTSTAPAALNASGGTYIFLAIA